AVGRQDDVKIGDLSPATLAVNTGLIQNFQPRREAQRFLLPIEDQGARHDDQGRTAPGIGIQKRQDLYGLAQAHVVCKTCSETELPNEVKPAQALTLILAQLRFERWRRRRR